MSSADVLSPPTTHVAEAGSLPATQELPQVVFGTQLLRGEGAKKPTASASWRNEAAKANASITSMLDRKAEAVDVVALDKYVQPIDRGPTVAEQKLMRSWQYAVTGKVAAAAVLADLKAEHIKHGGVLGMHAEACKNIQRHQLEGETFYIVDLGNVLRMYKSGKPGE